MRHLVLTLLLLASLLYVPTTACAQGGNHIFRQNPQIHAGDSLKLFLRIENQNFFKNNEYFNPLNEGYTQLVHTATPAFVYHPSNNTQVTMGAGFSKYCGMDNYLQIRPVFRFQYQVFPSINIIMGNLYGGLNHRLLEPIFQFERHFSNERFFHEFSNPSENGIQVKIDTKRIFSDTWLNWTRFIFPNSPYKEQFHFGTSNHILLTPVDTKWQTSLDFQAVGAHRGGQISTSLNPTISLSNMAVGIQAENTGNSKSNRSVGFRMHYLVYKDMSHEKHQPYKNGYGWYIQKYIQYENLTVTAGFWHGEKFIAPLGEPLFHSASYISPGYLQKTRNLLTGKIDLRHRANKQTDLSIRFEGYYDVNVHRFDYSYGLFVVYNNKFFLTKTK